MEERTKSHGQASVHKKAMMTYTVSATHWWSVVIHDKLLLKSFNLLYLLGLSFRQCLIHSVSKFEISLFPNSWVSLILRARHMRTMGIRWRVRLRGWSSMCRGKRALHKKWGNQITKVQCCSSYKLFNFKSRGWQFCLECQYLFINGWQRLHFATVVVQVPKTNFQTSNDSRHNRSGADLRLSNSLSMFSPYLLANGKKTPQAANCHRFLTIVLVHSVYGSVQGLSRQIQCYNLERSQATPEEVSKFSETWSHSKWALKSNCYVKEC